MPTTEPPFAGLKLRGLTKSFAKPVVDRLDLTVRGGEFYALLGPNGAGKTTTCGWSPDYCCRIRDRSDFRRRRRRQPVEAKRVTAWLPDEPMLDDKLDPFEYLEFVAGLWSVERSVAEARATRLLEVLELWPHRHERCEGFSRGMKQKVALAGALIHDPKLLMLDEPLTGLDARSRGR